MVSCPICNSDSYFLTLKNNRLNQKCEYFICTKCRFLFDKDLVANKNNLQNKVKSIYQKDYFQKIDWGWEKRGNKTFKIINKILSIYKFLGIWKENIKVLDYGGGNGYITSKISNDFNVFYYDKYTKPIFTGNYRILDKPIKTDIVCAVELVEHITNYNEWEFLNKLTSSILFFTTELSNGIEDGQLTKWWYLNPDAGHTCIYTLDSLYLLAKKYGFIYFFFPSKSFHIFLRNSFLSQFYFAKLEFLLYNFLRRIKHI